ncbi:MAG: hypothetical protein ABIC91_02540 [Nanoarchaeota archaeon]|nr:hypothetical protein [Nanoarchaeota archaeon]MBU1030281.1 hypothetical protein [Nanoarchaeota archaeon]MBU1850056.1 hypothetical protein [Nanoarchaeota archaeon]
MTDTVVSVRMPSSLVRELRILSEKNHFMDLSEEIRSIVRSKCLRYSQPFSADVKKLREELKEIFEVKKEQETKQELITQLKKLSEKLAK